MSRHAVFRCSGAAAAACGALLISAADSPAAPTIDAAHSADLQISQVATFTGGGSMITQMAFGPDGRVYASTNSRGVLRFDFNPATGALTNQATVANINGNGIGFHGGEMFLSNAYTSSADPAVRLSRLYRVTQDGSGNWTNSVRIVEGIPRDDHGVNNIGVVGDQLFVGVGVRTRNGAFQTFGGDDHGESAYGGSVAVIRDLNALSTRISQAVANGQSPNNVAGFFTANPTVAQYRALINGSDARGDDPYTSTDAAKLVVHSSGTRNPFGMSADGNGNIWFTNNFQRVSNNNYSKDPADPAFPDAFGGDGFADDIHDQFFRAVEKGDYGYRNDNWRPDQVNGFFNPANAVPSVTFDNSTPGSLADHDPANPDGLGPSSSSNGFDFYDANALPIEYHQQAFVSRWNGNLSDGGETLNYRDVVTVDPRTGEVTRIAHDFGNPIAVLTDPQGGLLVADFTGTVYRITAKSPAAGAHGISLAVDTNADWSDAAAWRADANAAVRLVPDQWGTARYAVTINRAGASPIVRLDQDADIESLALGERLVLEQGRTLAVSDAATVLPAGILGGNGTLSGRVNNAGSIAPGEPGAAGRLTVGRLDQDPAGRVSITLVNASTFDRLDVAGEAALDGSLQTTRAAGFVPEWGDAFEVMTFGSRAGTFDTRQTDGADAAHAFVPTYSATSLTLEYSRRGDADLNGTVDVTDLGILATNFNTAPAGATSWLSGDFSGDGLVDVTDLGMLATHFNATAAAGLSPDGVAGPRLSFDQALALPEFAALAAAVPEPAGALAVAAFCASAARRRRHGAAAAR
jgi:hypothetical protein